MPEAVIRSFAKFREMFGDVNKINVAEGTSVLDTVISFAEKTENAKSELLSGNELQPHIILMYNRERIDSSDAKEIKVKNGDEIVLYPPVSGG